MEDLVNNCEQIFLNMFAFDILSTEVIILNKKIGHVDKEGNAKEDKKSNSKSASHVFRI